MTATFWFFSTANQFEFKSGSEKFNDTNETDCAQATPLQRHLVDVR